MSAENLEVVRSILANWARGDYSSVGWVHADIAFRGGDGRESRGLDAVARQWTEFLEVWDHLATIPERFIDVGDGRVLVLVRFEGRGRGSGTPTTAFTGGQLFTLRDGKVIHLVLYTDTRAALDAVGLSE